MSLKKARLNTPAKGQTTCGPYPAAPVNERDPIKYSPAVRLPDAARRFKETLIKAFPSSKC